MREVPEWLTVGPRRVARVLRQSQRDRLEDTVAKLDIPVQVVVGEHDPLSQLPWQHSLSRPAGPPVVMAGLPHSAPHAAPARFARLVATGFGPSMPGMRPAREPQSVGPRRSPRPKRHPGRPGFCEPPRR